MECTELENARYHGAPEKAAYCIMHGKEQCMKRSVTLSLFGVAVLVTTAYPSRLPAQAAVTEPAAASVAVPARALPPTINDVRPAGRRDALAGSLERLARTAMKANLSEFEPWLFDRATSYYKLSLLTGAEDLKQHALELVERYYSEIDARGAFTLKPGDPDAKYSYTDGAVWFEYLTGDQRFRSKAEAIYKLWLNEFPARYSPAQPLWTEREMAYAFGAAVGWYALSREQAALARAQSLLAQWTELAAGSGAPLHTLKQHQEEFEPPWAERRMTSPWMAALFFEYVQHYQRLTQDRHALELVSSYADFLLKHCLYDGRVNHPNLSGYLLPYYLCGEDGYYERETPSEGDGEHAIDVMGIMAFAVAAKRELGEDPKAALDAYRELRTSAEYFVGRRSDVDPPRKINWWVGTSYDSTALVEGTAD
jgi:hypothetical protein